MLKFEYSANQQIVFTIGVHRIELTNLGRNTRIGIVAPAAVAIDRQSGIEKCRRPFKRINHRRKTGD